MEKVHADGTAKAATTRSVSVWNTVDGIFSKGARIIELTLAVAFILAVLANFFNAVDRFAFQRSIIGIDELQIYIMVWMTFVGAAVVTWRQKHLRMDVLVTKLPRAVRLGLYLAELALILVLMIIATSQSAKYAMFMQAIDRRSDLADFPMWVPHSGLAVGFGLIFLMTVWRIVEVFAAKDEPKEHPTDVRI